MMTSAAGWTEIEVDAPVALRDRVLLELFAPMLAGRAGLFLCELGRRADGRERTTLQLRRDDPAEVVTVAPDLPGAVVGSPRPARHVPLAGSVMAGPALAPVTRALLADATPMLLGLVGARRSVRLGATLDLMAAHLIALGPPAVPGADRAAGHLRGAPVGFLSFHSHAEAFIASSRDREATRRAFDERYASIRLTAVSRMRAILDEPESSVPAKSWYHAVRQARGQADEAFRAGSLWAQEEAEDSGPGFAGSAFHAELAGAPTFLRTLRTEPGFLGARLMTGLLYLSMANVGVTLAERYFLCHAVSRACSEIYGADPVSVLAALAGR
jgi:hypothetical protein